MKMKFDMPKKSNKTKKECNEIFISTTIDTNLRDSNKKLVEIPISGTSVSLKDVGDVDEIIGAKQFNFTMPDTKFEQEAVMSKLEEAEKELSNENVLKLKKMGAFDKKEILYHDDALDNKEARELANKLSLCGMDKERNEDIKESRINVNKETMHSETDSDGNDIVKRGNTEYGVEMINRFRGFNEGALNEWKCQNNAHKFIGLSDFVKFKKNENFVTADNMETEKLVAEDFRGLASTRKESVNHPEHYNLKNGPFMVVNGTKINIECIDVIRNMPNWKGNAIKYLWRCGEKEEEGLTVEQKCIEDIKKAIWYLEDKVKELEMLNN